MSSTQHLEYWSCYNLDGINVKVRSFSRENFPVGPNEIPPHFSNGSHGEGFPPFPTHKGYLEAREMIGHGTLIDLEKLSSQASSLIAQIFSNAFDHGSDAPTLDPYSPVLSSHQRETTCWTLVKLRLSKNLKRWKENQRAIGKYLPPKKSGLTRVSNEILNILGATDWPEALITNNTLFGCGIANLIIGAADVPTMFSNYVSDMVFYYEHGYNHRFPTLQLLLEKSLSDLYALRTLGGYERRVGVQIGKRYVQNKIELEERYKASLAYRSAARLNRRDVQILSFSESSLLGMAAEAIARGYDPGAVMSDLVFSSPGTDVVDVGSDLMNSEVMNSFLNVRDITKTGVVTEDVLRRIYDAFAAIGARTLTERWYEPVARMCGALYTWHIQNDRHMFLRRAILGWPKARKKPARPQREADFEEAFDEHYHTTGFSRPLDPEYECDGQETCNHVHDFLRRNAQTPLLRDLWWFLVIGPLKYVRKGKIDEQHERNLAEGSRLRMAQLFSCGLVLEMVWLIAHANHHAWQLNYLFEAAMFGSILDGGELIGKLDRLNENDLGN